RLNFRQVKRRRKIVRAWADVVEPQDRHQHQDRAEHGVQNEFHRGINPPLVSPNADQEIHGDQRQLPENEEQEKIERDKNTDHWRLDNQQRDEETLHVFSNRLPRSENCERRQERRQQHQEQTDAVNAQVVVNVGASNPIVEFLELISGVGGDESGQQPQRNHELGERHRE